MATSAISSTTSANTAVAASTSGTSSTSSTSSATSAQAASKAAAQKIVTSLGSGSGVDVNTLAQNLVDAERIPRQTAIQSKIDKNNARITGLSAVMFMLSDLRTKLAAMKDRASLSSFTASSSASAVSAVASSGASAGSHEVQVNRLATAKKLASVGFASDSSPINGGLPFQVSISKPGVKTGAVDPTRLSSATNGQMSSLVGVSLNGGRSDFGSLTVAIDGEDVEVTPKAPWQSLGELAADLQAQLREKRPLLTSLAVWEDPTGQLNFDAGVGHTAQSPSLGGLDYDVRLDGLSFGDPPGSYFRELTVRLGGAPVTLTVPNLDPATPQALAQAIQSQLSDRYSVTAVGGASDFGLYLSDSSGSPIDAPSLIAEDGTQEGASVGQSSRTKSTAGLESAAWVTGVGLGAVADFKDLELEVDGVRRSISPASGLPSLTALAQDLQDKLSQEVGGIKVEAIDGGLKITSEDGSQRVSKARLNPAAGATFLGGANFGTTPSVDDFKSFSVVIGGVKRTVTPSPTAATPQALAASLQSQLRSTDSDVSVRAVPDGAGSFGLYLSSSTGRQIASPVLQTNVVDLSVGNYEVTLAGVARAINDKRLGLTAQVVNTGAASSPYKLLVTGETGAKQDFEISSSDASGDPLGFDNSHPLTVAQDAEIVVDGMTLARSTNTVSDAIEGVTLSLKGTTPSAASLDVSLDTSPLKTKMADLVAAYNDNWDLLNQVSDPKSTLGTYGATLVGESLVRTIKQQVRALFQGNSSTPGASVSSLWQMGIKVDERGVMSLDSNTFDATVRGNYADVVKSLTGNLDNQLDSSTDPAGFAGDAYKRLTKLIAPREKNGLIDSATYNASTQNTKYEQDLTKLQTRMDALLVRYQKQLAAMDSLVGSTNSQKASLKSSFDGMMSVYTKN